MKTTAQTNGITRPMLWVLSVASAIAVGNLYWIQPLLSEVASEFNVSSSQASYLVTVTQVGYAVGVLLLLPLGDALNRKRFIPTVMLIGSLMLFLCSIANNFELLLIGLGLVGVFTISGQLIVPLAGSLASEEKRGQIVGILASGILCGILLSRTISGLLADIFGWRAIYVFAGVTSLILSVILARVLPAEKHSNKVNYIPLLASVINVVYRYRAIQVTLLITSCVFVVFSMFWTSITFLLSAEPYSYSMSQIGLVGLLGFAGALAARNAGKLHDKGLSVPMTGVALSLVFVSIIISWWGHFSILMLLGAVLLLDMAIQTLNVLNQTRIISLEPQSRSRINTAFIVVNFVAAAFGSVLAGILWQHGGWDWIVFGETSCVLLSLLFWWFGKRALGKTQAETEEKVLQTEA